MVDGAWWRCRGLLVSPRRHTAAPAPPAPACAGEPRSTRARRNCPVTAKTFGIAKAFRSQSANFLHHAKSLRDLRRCAELPDVIRRRTRSLIGISRLAGGSGGDTLRGCVTCKRRVSRIGVLTHVRTLEPVMIADLDTLLTALYVELTDRIIPLRGLGRHGPGRPPEVTDAELACLAVAQVLLRHDDERH